MPFLAFALGLLPSPRALWRFIVSPPGLCVLVALALATSYGVGHYRGGKKMAAVYEARIAESIRKNAEFDRKLQEEAKTKADQQRAEADERVAAAEQKVQEYEEKYKSCAIGDGAADWLNAPRGMPAPGRVIPKPPSPPRRP